MKKFVFQISLLIGLALLGMYVTFNPGVLGTFGLGNAAPNTNPPSSNTSVKQIKIKDTVIKAEIADKVETRQQGLANRESLPQDGGMLFVFDSPGKYTFWMKGVSFPLDLLWLRSNKIVQIDAYAAPVAPTLPEDQIPRYPAKQEVDTVLEVNGGFAQFYNIQVGDSIEIMN